MTRHLEHVELAHVPAGDVVQLKQNHAHRTLKGTDVDHFGMVTRHLAELERTDVKARIREAVRGRMQSAAAFRCAGDGEPTWPRELTHGELDVYGRGFNDGWRQGYAAGRAA